MTDALARITPFLNQLLNRDPISVERSALPEQIRDSKVLITGAGGSIGSELAKVMLNCHPRGLALMENHENSLFQLQRSLGDRVCESGVYTKFVLADVRDTRRMRQVLEGFRPDVVFHLAAYKHVPLAEEFPEEFVLMNVLGTWHLSRLASEMNVRKLVYPSTDKAVKSPSVYGATKRTIELTLRALAAEEKATRFTVVRLVNVLGAQGGVVETFVKQITSGQPVTITHPEMTRYWITMSEALFLLIQAAYSAGTGDILFLDMGDPIKVDDVARNLWRLLRPGEGELQPSYVGIRPGERLSEELTGPHEVICRTNTTGLLEIRRTGGEPYSFGEVVAHLNSLEELARKGNREELRRRLFEFVRPG